ncbi:MAG: ABC transporter permease [Imperialibacter sp.]|uniref:ABC transporter permease n=1 Tax=Imperialibacter sp. TaxID=2038411 RepID=UPI0032EC4514
MFKNYFTIALRNLLKNKGFSAINILGLALGMAATLAILYYVRHETSYDKFHARKDQIYRVTTETYNGDILSEKAVVSGREMGPALKADFPDVANFARIHPEYGSALVTYFTDFEKRQIAHTFSLPTNDTIQLVAVTGNFCGWCEGVQLKKKDNKWQATVMLLPGDYMYQFAIGDTTIVDPGIEETNEDGDASIIHIAAPEQAALGGGQEISFREEHLAFVDPSFLKVFSFPVVIGDPDHQLEGPNTLVITKTIAEKYLQGDNPIGKVLRIGNRQSYTVTGVIDDMPDNSHFHFDFLMPMANIIATYKDAPWGWTNFYTYVELKESADALALSAQLPGFVEKHQGEELRQRNVKEILFLQPLADIHLRSNLFAELETNGSMETVRFLSLLALFIFVIACINFLNLSTARAVSRAKEVGVRKVTGASRGWLVRQFLFEAFLVNLIALVIGITLFQVSLPYMAEVAGIPESLSVWSVPLFWLLVGGMLVVGTLLSGIYPAMVLSSYQPVVVLKGKFGNSAKGNFLKKGLVVFQFMVSAGLVASILVVFLQLQYLRNQPLGVDISDVLVLKAPLLRGSDFRNNVEKFRTQMAAIPEVVSYSNSSAVPGEGYQWTSGGWRKEGAPEDQRSRHHVIVTDKSYVETYKIEILAGNNFSEKPAEGTDYSELLLSEASAKALGFTTPEEAVNSFISSGEDRMKVIGVFKNYSHESLKSEYPNIALYNYPWARGLASLRLQGDNLQTLLPKLTEAWETSFPGNPMEYFFLEDSFNKQYAAEERFETVFTTFTFLALFVACLGLFGLVSYQNTLKSKEIAIRKVIGASVSNIFYLLSQGYLKLVLIASVLALPAVWYFNSEWLSGFANRIELGWWFYVLPLIAVMMIAFVTVGYKTLQAAKGNPTENLRYE